MKLVNNKTSRKPNTPVNGAGYWLLFARSAFLILLSFELVIRIFIMKNPAIEYKPGWGLVPLENSYRVQGLEGFAITHLMANGEVSTPYADGDISIVVLGDSTTRSAQVSNSANYVSLTEVGLRARGINADLHNLGRRNRGVADHVYIAPYVNEAYQPEIVVLQINSLSFEMSYHEGRESYFVVQENGELELIHNENPHADSLALTNLVSSSGLLSLLDYRLEKTFPQLKLAQRQVADVTAELPGLNGTNGPPDQNSQEITVRGYSLSILSQINALRVAYPSSKLVLLIIPYPPSFVPIPGQDASWTSNKDHGLAQVLERTDGVSLVYTLKSFQELYRATHVLPRGTFNSEFNYGHLNRLGHQAVAADLIALLEELLK